MYNKDKYFTFGCRKFGPFLYGFVRWLKRELEAKGYDKVFFFSRDGYMMKKAFDLINDTEIETHYVYFSRKALRTPLLWKCRGFEDSLKYLSWERYISVGKLLEYYGFDKTERESLAAEGGFTLETDIPFDKMPHSALVRRLYENNRDIINARSKEQDRLLAQYTDELGMRGKFAIVDIGWKGNMQYYLELFFKSLNISADMEGWYIGIERSAPSLSPMNGYLFSEKDMSGKKKIMCFFGGYEKLLQGFEGSTAGYVNVSGKVKPRLMEYEYTGDKQVIAAIKAWQTGALCFVKKAGSKKLSVSDKKLTEPLIRFGMAPSLNDTKLFSFFYNIDGTKVYFTPQKPLYCFKPRELIHALANSPWKTGFMKALFKVPGPYYLIYRSLRK